jgi:hypothetical protein
VASRTRLLTSIIHTKVGDLVGALTVANDLGIVACTVVLVVHQR